MQEVNKGWIGVDLDGTLAHYDGWKGSAHIGEPVPSMLDRVKRWLSEGRDVRIFTARVSHDRSPERMKQAAESRAAIVRWCVVHLGRRLRVTNVKDFEMLELWDDRAVQVVPNTGEPVGSSTRGLV